MTLQEAVRIGKGLDLTTIEECVDAIHSHAPQLFPYSKINEELSELYEEYDNYKKHPETWMTALCGMNAPVEKPKNKKVKYVQREDHKVSTCKG